MAEKGTAILASELVYAAGNFGKAILHRTLEFTLLYMFTDLLDIAPGFAGALIGLSILFDALIDPFIGIVADRTSTRFGRYGPFILIGAPLASLSFLAIATLPLWTNGSPVLIGLLLLVFRFGYSVMDVAHNALIGAVTSDSRARSVLAGWRLMFSTLAGLALALWIGPLGTTDDQALSPHRFWMFATGAALTSLIVMILSWWAVRDRDRAGVTEYSEPNSAKATSAALWSSQAFVFAMLAGTLAALTLPLHSKSYLYLAQYWLRDEQASGQMLLALTCGQLIAVAPWLWAARYFETARALQAAHFACIVGFAVAAGVGIEHYSLLLLGLGIAGFGMFGVYSFVWGMIADCVDDVKSRSGIMLQGLMFSLAILAQQGASGLGVGAFGAGLQSIGYQPGQSPSEPLSNLLYLFAFVLPVAGSALCIGILQFYPLTHAAHALLVNEGKDERELAKEPHQ